MITQWRSRVSLTANNCRLRALKKIYIYKNQMFVIFLAVENASNEPSTFSRTLKLLNRRHPFSTVYFPLWAKSLSDSQCALLFLCACVLTPSPNERVQFSFNHLALVFMTWTETHWYIYIQFNEVCASGSDVHGDWNSYVSFNRFSLVGNVDVKELAFSLSLSLIILND